MGDVAAEVHQIPRARTMLLDDRGVGMRATWHQERGIANLSIWREDRCVETFRLAVADVPRLIGFLAEGLGEAAARRPPLRAADEVTADRRAARPDLPAELAVAVRRVRHRLATWLAP